MASSPVIIPASGKHTATVIFLHGLGDTGHGWSDAFKGKHQLPHIKYICPTAPVAAVTLNHGMAMNSWFDLRSLSPDGPEDEDGIISSSKTVLSLIEKEEANGIPSSRIILGGFSQGGALALYTALRYNKPLAGVVALSCWLPLNGKFPDAALGNKDTRVLQCHGTQDLTVLYDWGKATHIKMKSFMANVEFKTYDDIAHGSSQQEMNDVRDFMLKVAPEQ